MESDNFPADQQGSPSSGSQALEPLAADAIIQGNGHSAAATHSSAIEDLDTLNWIEPPPLDWRSDTSSETGSVDDLDEPGFPPAVDGKAEAVPPLVESDAAAATLPTTSQQELMMRDNAEVDMEALIMVEEEKGVTCEQFTEEAVAEEEAGHSIEDAESRGSQDEDHTRIHALLNRLHLMGEEPLSDLSPQSGLTAHSCYGPSELKDDATEPSETSGLLFSESHHRDFLGLLECTEIGPSAQGSCPTPRGEVDAVVSVSYSQDDAQHFWGRYGSGQQFSSSTSFKPTPEDALCEPLWKKREELPPEENTSGVDDQSRDYHPSYKDVPGPCDPEDLLDGVMFAANYLGSTQIRSDKNPSTNARMAQAQEAVDRIKAPEGESQPMTEVDLFISTQRIKVLNTDSQEAMMDHSLQMISYIADIDNVVVLMARRKPASRKAQGGDGSSSSSSTQQKKCWMICHVFTSDDAQIIAQAIGQAFGVAYQQFLQTSGIKPSQLRPGDYSDFLGTQELYNGDLAHFSDSQNLRDVIIIKSAGEILGLAVVESGWGSILPTVVVANMLHGGPAERSGDLSIGDRIMSVNGTSLVGLPIATCQGIIRDLKSESIVKLSIVHCPPVTMAIIKRPDPKFQLGFSVEDGIICSLMRGGIAERGGIRVGHRIIEINGQSVVATQHDKIIHTLTNAVGEIHLKTMPASTYRLLTGQEQPMFL